MSCNCNTYGWDPEVISINRAAETDDTKIAKCASLELAACRAENYQLKQKLTEYEATIKNLENMVTTIADKQQQILNELREENFKSLTSMPQPGLNLRILENDEGEMGDDEGDDEFLSQTSAAPSDLESEIGDSDDEEGQDDSSHTTDTDSDLI